MFLRQPEVPRDHARIEMKHLFFVLLLGALGLITASARIGENEAQIAARYGKTIGDIPTAAFGKVRGFMQPGYLVGVAFVDGVSDMEMFSKTDQSDITSSEMENHFQSQWRRRMERRGNWQTKLETLAARRRRARRPLRYDPAFPLYQFEEILRGPGPEAGHLARRPGSVFCASSSLLPST